MSLLDYFGNSFVFRSRPEAIPGDFRPLWRISIILLTLKFASWGNKSTLSRLHVLNWAIRTSDNRESIRRIISGDLSPDKVIVRIEPSLIRALELARGEGLIEYLSGKTIKLTNKGNEVAENISKEPNLFSEEMVFLEEIGKRNLNETIISQIFSEGFQ